MYKLEISSKNNFQNIILYIYKHIPKQLPS